MKAKKLAGAVASGVILLAVVGSNGQPNTTTKDSGQSSSVKSNSSVSATPKPKPTCDGNKITSNCLLNNVNYKTYLYHEAKPEKSHTEQVTTYEEKITDYCTLCQDGTYSPTCATGRGACSHHGGVAQWNAPMYSNVPVYSTKKVIDSPAAEAYYEKIAE